MDTKKVNKVIRAAKSVARQGTKLVGVSLPLASIVMNVIDSNQRHPVRADLALKHFIAKYNGIDDATGKFSWDVLAKGTGALVTSAVAGWIITQVA